MYVEHLVHVFRKVRRVLAPWGTVWLNIGDSYWGGKGQSAHGSPERLVERLARGETINKPHQEIGGPGMVKPGDGRHDVIKPKDLCLIPARVAIALQADGWWVRAAPPWLKVNVMPESVSDRPTTAHEQIFLLTKNAGRPLYWTHRDGLTTDGAPAPDYRYVHAMGCEQREEPENWRRSIIRCPVCGGDGWAEVPAGDMFGDRTITVECANCCRRAGAAPETEEGDGHEGREPRPGEVREWRRINLWRGHDYFYDADAIRKPLAVDSLPRLMRGVSDSHKWSNGPDGQGQHTMSRPRPNLKVGRTERKMEGTGYGEDGQGLHGHSGYFDGDGRPRFNPAGRNRRTADWFFESLDLAITAAEARARYLRGVRDAGGMLLDDAGNPAALLVNTEPFADAHFAVFPPALVEPCVRAGAPTRVCAICGKPWERVTKIIKIGYAKHNGSMRAIAMGHSPTGPTSRGSIIRDEKETLGFTPTCACGGETARARVFDPFAGSGTVAEVAIKLGHDAVVLDASEKYCAMAVRRLERLVQQEALFR